LIRSARADECACTQIAARHVSCQIHRYRSESLSQTTPFENATRPTDVKTFRLAGPLGSDHSRSGPLLTRVARGHPWLRGFVSRQNNARTFCYHFATQLGSTGRYGPEQGRTLGPNSIDNSVLAGTEQNTKRRPQPNYECGVLAILRTACSGTTRRDIHHAKSIYKSGEPHQDSRSYRCQEAMRASGLPGGTAHPRKPGRSQQIHSPK
jgi:hypothetical protein